MVSLIATNTTSDGKSLNTGPKEGTVGLREFLRAGLICAAYIAGAHLICGLIGWLTYEPGDVALGAGIMCFLIDLAAVGIASHGVSRFLAGSLFITLVLTLVLVAVSYFVSAVATGLLSPLTNVEAMLDASQGVAPLLLFSALVGSISGIYQRST